MKKQTFIAYLKDEHGRMINFERFACKRAETVKRQMKTLLDDDLYKACTRGAAVMEIYATPDGYHASAGPVIIETI